jgi:hypothetical protein
MLKAFRDLVDNDVQVSVETGLRAAEKLQAVLDGRDHGDDLAEMRLQVNQILDAVRSTVPQEMWGQIARKLDRGSRRPIRSTSRWKPSTTLTRPSTLSKSAEKTSCDLPSVPPAAEVRRR